MVDEKLICMDYKGAKSPADQVRIISELHGISVNEVIDILKKYKFDVPKKIPSVATNKVLSRKKDSINSDFWNEEKINELKDMAKNRVPLPEVSDIMGVSVSCIRSKMKKLGIYYNNYKIYVDKKELEKMSNTMSFSEAAKRLGMNSIELYNFSKDQGVCFRKNE